MITFATILIIAVVVCLILVAAMHPDKSSLSGFELQRRSQRGHHGAQLSLRRESLRADLLSLRGIVGVLLVIASVLLCITVLGWGWGALLAIVVALFYGSIARLTIIQTVAAKIYRSVEPALLTFIGKAPWLFAVIRQAYHDSDNLTLGSREELEHLVHESAGILTEQEKNLIIHGLQFGGKSVRSVMTPKGMIDSIKKSELLGPLVLSELHTVGHSRLPVIDKDIDHVVGILHVKDLLTLDDKKTHTAEKAMEPKVYYINEHESLEHALAAFLKARHHLFIVVNEFRETVGLITIEDVVETLLGRKIVDEDDVHDDVRAAAMRNPHRNNQPPAGKDV